MDVFCFLAVTLMASYVVEMLIRSSEAKKPARLIPFHHFLSISFILLYIGPVDASTIIPLESLMDYYRIGLVMTFVAMFDFVGEFGFLGYRLWNKTHPTRTIILLRGLAAYGVILRVASHAIFFVLFGTYVADDRLHGPFKWVLLSVQIVFAAIEYYYVFVLLVIVVRVQKKSTQAGALGCCAPGARVAWMLVCACGMLVCNSTLP